VNRSDQLIKLAWEQAEGKPLLVHCSAGIGRTGTFVCLDRLMGDMDHNSSVDVRRTLVRLRKQRLFSVQSDVSTPFTV